MPEPEPTAEGRLALKPKTLWTRILARTEQALRCGALISIPTDYEFVEQAGVRFLVRLSSNLSRKDQAQRKPDPKTLPVGPDFNPFLPYEAELFVADLSETHVCILNKFNVAAHHLLIITRAFEDQETALTLRDFEAMWACLSEVEGLVFYNAGQKAGASQRHKHLQLISLPLAPEGPQIPIEALLPSAPLQGSTATIPALPFAHAFVPLNCDWPQSPGQAAATTLECYRTLLHTLGLQSNAPENGPWRPGAYNLLVTRQWMLMVPRVQEGFGSIAVNSLGFAGALLVRSQQQLQLLKEHGPMTILKQVARAKTT